MLAVDRQPSKSPLIKPIWRLVGADLALQLKQHPKQHEFFLAVLSEITRDKQPKPFLLIFRKNSFAHTRKEKYRIKIKLKDDENLTEKNKIKKEKPRIILHITKTKTKMEIRDERFRS